MGGGRWESTSQVGEKLGPRYSATDLDISADTVSSMLEEYSSGENVKNDVASGREAMRRRLLKMLRKSLWSA